MHHRRFGRTKIPMPVLTCGGMRFQQAWKDVPPGDIDAAGQANLEATIRRSVDAGINHIETARGYGTSEMQLGRILPRLPRKEIIVQTKVGPTEDAAEFLRTFETSMGHLGLDHVDLLSLHGINNRELSDWSLRDGGCLEAAESLRRAGRVLHVGFSTHGDPTLIADLCATGRFDYVNLHWYFVNPFTWSAVEAATRADMGVFIISPNDKGGKLYEPPQKLVRLCAPLHPMQFNALYCLARPEVHTLSIGAARPEDFDVHLESVEMLDQAAEHAKPIAARLDAALAEELGQDWMDGWWKGLPAWNDVPGEINVHEILRLWNFAKGLDMIEFARMRYNLLGNADHWFPGRNAGEMDEAAVREACAASPFADRIPDILRDAHALLFTGQQKRLSES